MRRRRSRRFCFPGGAGADQLAAAIGDRMAEKVAHLPSNHHLAIRVGPQPTIHTGTEALTVAALSYMARSTPSRPRGGAGEVGLVGLVGLDVAAQDGQQGAALCRREAVVAADGVLGADLVVGHRQPRGVQDQVVVAKAKAVGDCPQHAQTRLVTAALELAHVRVREVGEPSQLALGQPVEVALGPDELTELAQVLAPERLPRGHVRRPQRDDTALPNTACTIVRELANDAVCTSALRQPAREPWVTAATMPAQQVRTHREATSSAWEAQSVPTQGVRRTPRNA